MELQSLRCRSGNRQTNEQLHKIMQTCRKKYGKDYNMSNDNDSSDGDTTSSGSFDEELFFGSSDRASRMNNSKSRGNYNGQSSNDNYE